MAAARTKWQKVSGKREREKESESGISKLRDGALQENRFLSFFPFSYSYIYVAYRHDRVILFDFCHTFWTTKNFIPHGNPQKSQHHTHIPPKIVWRKLAAITMSCLLRIYYKCMHFHRKSFPLLTQKGVTADGNTFNTEWFGAWNVVW